jgi:hypothetical protein
MDEGIFKVRLYGDSLALPRPGYVKFSERYISLLCDWWKKQEGVRSIELCDRSKSNSTVAHLFQQYADDNNFFGPAGDVLIIHCGIVDCAPRPVPRWMRNRIERLPSALRQPAIKFLHDHRAQILRRTGGWRQLGPQEFRAIYRRWLAEALNQFSRVYLINIAPTNEATEAHSPGLSRSIVLYNEMIAELVSALNAENLFLIDVHQHIGDNLQEIDRYIVSQDGHHITALSNRLCSDEIKKHEARYFRSSLKMSGDRILNEAQG